MAKLPDSSASIGVALHHLGFGSARQKSPATPTAAVDIVVVVVAAVVLPLPNYGRWGLTGGSGVSEKLVLDGLASGVLILGLIFLLPVCYSADSTEAPEADLPSASTYRCNIVWRRGRASSSLFVLFSFDSLYSTCTLCAPSSCSLCLTVLLFDRKLVLVTPHPSKTE